MQKLHTIVLAALLTAAACGGDSTSSTSLKTAQAAEPSSTRRAEQDFQWGPAPSVFPPGAQMALLAGDPSKAGEEFTVRLKFPNGYKIMPHTHPTTENVTVLTGTFLAGMGTEFRAADLKPFGRDAFASIPGNHAHYAQARGLTIVQVHAIGPFALTYVNPNDLPVAAR
jgi:hypothetical protein